MKIAVISLKSHKTKTKYEIKLHVHSIVKRNCDVSTVETSVLSTMHNVEYGVKCNFTISFCTEVTHMNRSINENEHQNKYYTLQLLSIMH